MLKKNLLAGLAVLACAAGLGAGPAYGSPDNSLTLQPVGLLFGIGNVEYENLLSDTNAIAARINFFNWGLGDWNTSGIGAGVSYRFFPLHQEQAPRGLWYGPAVDILNVSSTFEGASGSSLFVSILGEVGYKWLFGREIALVVSPFLNLGYTIGSLQIGDSSLPWGGLTFNLGLSAGVAF